MTGPGESYLERLLTGADARGVALDTLARAAGREPAELQAAVDEGRLSTLTLLHLTNACALVTPGRDDPLTTALAPLWAAWGPRDTGPRQAIAAFSRWAEEDRLLAVHAVPRPQTRPDSLAGRGAPRAATSALVREQLPAVRPSAADVAAAAEVETGGVETVCRLAGAVRDALDIAGAMDPWQVADTHGVAAGRSPLGEQLYAACVRLRTPDGRAALVVVNSDLAADVQRRALAHQLVHLVFDQVAYANYELVPDQDDDSIYCCTGVDWRVCHLAERVTAALLHGDDSVRDAHERREAQFAAFAAGTHGPASMPEPVLEAGEQPGYWAAAEVYIPPVSLRRELGKRHRDLLENGDGRDVWPPALARRWVGVVERGFDRRAEAAAHFGFGEPGHPSVDEVETALRRARHVEAQLGAAHGGELGL